MLPVFLKHLKDSKEESYRQKKCPWSILLDALTGKAKGRYFISK